MKNKLIVIIGAVVIIAGGAIYLAVQHNSAQASTGLAAINTKQALALPRDAACLANNDSIKTQVEALPQLSEQAGPWTSQIYDVPAGTNVDVNVNNYNGGDTVTGSLIYPKQYGSYNYTLTKQTDGWRFTQFAGCN